MTGFVYCPHVRWDLFFEDLEGQLASEWEAERAALDTEAERLRLSRVALRTRLGALLHAPGDTVNPPSTGVDDGAVSIEANDGTVLTAPLEALGADWVALAPRDQPMRGGVTIVPLGAIVALTLAHADVLRSARPVEARGGLADRMTLGFVLRDLARRRIPLSLALASGRMLTGTVDRAGTDHLDLALHDAGAPRRAGEVRGHRLVPFAGIAWIRVDQPGGMPGA